MEKERENSAALEVLPDLLAELDSMAPRPRLLSLVEGVLAANIFDWGASACVQLYQAGTILDIYREARRKLSRRPWRVDQFDHFCERVLGRPAGEGTCSLLLHACFFFLLFLFFFCCFCCEDGLGNEAIASTVPLSPACCNAHACSATGAIWHRPRINVAASQQRPLCDLAANVVPQARRRSGGC